MRARRANAAPRAVSALLAAILLIGAAGPAVGATGDDVPAATVAPTSASPVRSAPTRSATATQPLFMWTVQSPTATVHLLGSVHVGTADFYPLDDAIEAAFAASDGLAVELDMTDPETVSQSTSQFLAKAMYPADDSLTDHVSPETRLALAEYAQARGMPLVVLERMRPGAAAMYVVLDELQRRGYDPARGVDVYFLERARPERTVLALETVEQQIDAIFGDDAVVDELLLVEALTKTATLDSMMTAMVAAWQEGDAATMAALIEQEMLADERLRAFHDRILTDRNARMLTGIEALLASDRTWFVVVGAAHLVGETGLVARLADAGYVVAQVYGTAGE